MTLSVPILSDPCMKNQKRTWHTPILAGNGFLVVTLATSPSLWGAECMYKKLPPPPTETEKKAACGTLVQHLYLLERLMMNKSNPQRWHPISASEQERNPITFLCCFQYRRNLAAEKCSNLQPKAAERLQFVRTRKHLCKAKRESST